MTLKHITIEWSNLLLEENKMSHSWLNRDTLLANQSYLMQALVIKKDKDKLMTISHSSHLARNLLWNIKARKLAREEVQRIHNKWLELVLIKEIHLIIILVLNLKEKFIVRWTLTKILRWASIHYIRSQIKRADLELLLY